MSDTKKLIILSVIMVLLAGLFVAGISKSNSSYGMRAIKTVLLNQKYIESIARISISNNSDSIELLKQRGRWYCKSDGISAFLNTNLLQELIQLFTRQRTVYYISNKVKSWENYGVDAENANKITFSDEDGNPIQTLYFGFSGFDAMNIYFRTEKTNTVYLTQDEFYSLLNTNISFWADMRILPDYVFSLQKDNVLRIQIDGKRLDNEKIDTYINKLVSLRFSALEERTDFNGIEPEKTVTIETTDKTLCLYFYRKNDTFWVLTDYGTENSSRYCGEISRWTMNTIESLE